MLTKKCKTILRILALHLCLLFSLFISGCGSTPLKEDLPADFSSFSDQLFRTEICSNTIDLHYTLAYPENYGIEDYEVTLGSLSAETFEQNYAHAEEILLSLKSYDYNSLSREEQICYDIIKDSIETDLSIKNLYLFTEVLSPTTGYQAQLPVLFAEYNFRTKRDIENYLTLLTQVDDIFSDIIEFEHEKSAAGLFMPDYAAEDVISQCENFIAIPEENYMIDIFNEHINAFSGLSAEEAENYKKKNREIITTEVINGYQILIDGLTALLGTGTNENGLCNYENGDRYYEYLVRTSTGSDKSIKQLQKATERFISNSMFKISSLLVANPDIYTSLETYSFDLTEPEEILNDLAIKVTKDFPAPPNVEYTIKYVHESMEEHMSPAFYLVSPIDDISQNVIYINRANVSENLYTTLAHEGYPGHLYQNVYTNNAKLPLVRNLFSFPGYNEGWATYVEYYAYGISGLEENLAQLLALNNAASLGLYAYIDMGIHYNGWTLEDVTDYLSDYGLGDRETSELIFRTLVEEPANYLSYFIGYLEFTELRNKAEEALGENFNLSSFHDFLLCFGDAPFDIIEKYMDIWITENK